MARWDQAAVQLGIFAQSSVPGNQTYTTDTGEVHESVGSAFSFFSYLSVSAFGYEINLLKSSSIL